METGTIECLKEKAGAQGSGGWMVKYFKLRLCFDNVLRADRITWHKALQYNIRMLSNVDLPESNLYQIAERGLYS